jgi:uncharacterized membrane protein (DUF373 family)
MLNVKVKKVFDLCVDAVFGLILVVIIVGIAVGVVQLMVSVSALFDMKGVTGHYIDIIEDVLTLYVMVELSRSLTDYFETHKLRLTFIVDASLVFVLREILIGLFKHELPSDMIYAYSALVLVLGIVRTAAVLVYQREKLIMNEVK